VAVAVGCECQEALFEAGGFSGHRMDDDLVGVGELAQRGRRHGGHQQLVGTVEIGDPTLGAQELPKAFGVRGPDPKPDLGHRVEVCQGSGGDELAAVDDDDVVDGLGDFAQCVAGQEYGAAVGGEAPQQRAQP
jgi:hypothetical protein